MRAEPSIAGRAPVNSPAGMLTNPDPSDPAGIVFNDSAVPNNLPENWLESEQFRTLIGDVLVDILDDQVKEGTVQFANTNSED